jgi:type I restriction-modification system DNA methylase subunit
MSNTFTEDEARAFEQLLAGFKGSPRSDLGTIRAKWKRNVVAVHDVPALLAQIKELARERDEARAQLAAELKEKP